MIVQRSFIAFDVRQTGLNFSSASKLVVIIVRDLIGWILKDSAHAQSYQANLRTIIISHNYSLSLYTERL